MMTSDHRQVSITALDDEESARERRLRMGGLHDRQSPAHGSLSKKRFYEPRGVYRGRDEIHRIAGAIKATHPDFPRARQLADIESQDE